MLLLINLMYGAAEPRAPDMLDKPLLLKPTAWIAFLPECEGQGNFITIPMTADLFLKCGSFLSNSPFLVFSQVQFQACEWERCFLIFSFSESTQEQSVPQWLPLIKVSHLCHCFTGSFKDKHISDSGFFQVSELGYHKKGWKRPG